MKYNVQLLSFNNYYNRRVLKYDTLAEYENFIVGSVDNCNFEMKDGIRSKIYINSAFVPTQPDYILVIERNDDGTNSEVFSRWFIIDSDLVRGNQYEFSLKRDICVDFFDLMTNSSYFVERGYLSPSNDLIFNDEGQLYSQIKKYQVELRDETYGPWIVGYIPREIGKNSDFTIKGVAVSNAEDITTADITLEPWYQYTTDYVASDEVTEHPYALLSYIPATNSGANNNYELYFFELDLKNKIATDDPLNVPPPRPVGVPYPTDSWNKPAVGVRFSAINNSTNFNNWKTNTGWYFTNQLFSSNGVELNAVAYLNKWCENLSTNALAYSQMMTNLKDSLPVSVNNSDVNYINNVLKGKTIKDLNTGKKYTISVQEIEVNEKLTIDASLNTSIRYLMPSSANTIYGTITKYVEDSTVKNDNLTLVYHIKKYKIVLVESYGVKTDIPKDDAPDGTIYRQHLEDAPYDMFAIPFNNNLAIKDGLDTVYPNTNAALSIASAFITSLGDTKVYDVQVLPYCPVRQYIKNDFTFDITAAGNTQVRPIVDAVGGTTVLNYVFYCSSSQMENITLLNPNNNYEPYRIEIGNIKTSANVDMWRLCSPNFASIFEFNAAKNNGVDYFEFSANYKPYNPYVKVKPHFERLYGINDKDARGLILQGDFSIPTMNNAWTDYELQNKNYLNTFNREIESLELQKEIGGTQDVWKAISGTFQGAAGGAFLGGAYGAVAGGAVSAVAGGVDIYNNVRLRNDAIDKAKDLFNYNLQNIKALPNSIRNVGCLTADNLLVPLLEYYSASDNEIDAFNRKIKFYGMSVNSVGSLYEFINPEEETFVKGYLLRLLPPDGVSEEADNHLAEELSDEVSKGLYIGG